MSKKKNTLNGINGRLNTREEEIREFKDIAVEIL